jgi:hypothetical protein
LLDIKAGQQSQAHPCVTSVCCTSNLKLWGQRFYIYVGWGKCKRMRPFAVIRSPREEHSTKYTRKKLEIYESFYDAASVLGIHELPYNFSFI